MIYFIFLCRYITKLLRLGKQKMPSYEQIREIEHQLYNVLNDFKFITENPDFKQIFDDAEKYDKEKKYSPYFFTR